MALNDAELVRLRLVLKKYEDTIEAMLDDRTRTAGQTATQHQALLEKLRVLMKKFAQTERAVGNAMHIRPRQQVGAFGPGQARSRMSHLTNVRGDAERLIQRIAGLLQTGPMPIDFKHKGIVDIANKIENQFTEIGDAYNPILTDGPSVSAMTHQGGGMTLVFHVLILMLELARVGTEMGSFTRSKKSRTKS
ncbi:MAG: hypothetical protein ACI9U2_004044 [Bradymonadia bacterium]|jgi:hypothetical protein